jgi:hypothetical protein
MVIVLAQRMLSDQVQESVFCHGHVPLKFNRILGKMDRQKSHNWCPPVTVFPLKPPFIEGFSLQRLIIGV